jgi:hypothetical protein
MRQKNGIFDFYYCLQKFSAYNLFWVNLLCFFYNGFELSIEFCILSNYCKNIFCFYLHILLNLKQNTDETVEKTKNAFYKCVLESHFTLFSGPGGSILSKKSKSMTPSVQ